MQPFFSLNRKKFSDALLVIVHGCIGSGAIIAVRRLRRTVLAAENQEMHDICARHLVEMAADVIMLHLLMYNATVQPEMFERSARVYANFVEAEIAKHYAWIMHFDAAQLADYRQAQFPFLRNSK